MVQVALSRPPLKAQSGRMPLHYYYFVAVRWGVEGLYPEMRH